MELAVGYYLKKKLYILNPLPDYNKYRWAFEVAIMKPICIKGNVLNIS